MKKISKKQSPKDIIIDRKRQVLSNLVKREMQKNFNSGYSRVAGLSFDSMLSAININGLYEKDYLEVFIQWLSENNLIRGCAIDVGANIGNHSVFFSKYFKRVMAFEPSPLIFKVLNLNAELSEGTIKCFPFGVSESSRKVQFFTPKNTHICSSRIVDKEIEEPNNSIMVDLVALDEMKEIISEEVGLLKIDVEGHELQVLNGARNLIETNHPIIIFEQHKKQFKNGSSPCIELLKDFNYSFFKLEYSPDSSNNLSFFKRKLNFLSSIIFGRTLSVVPENHFPAANYNFIIGLHQ